MSDEKLGVFSDAFQCRMVGGGSVGGSRSDEPMPRPTRRFKEMSAVEGDRITKPMQLPWEVVSAVAVNRVTNLLPMSWRVTVMWRRSISW